MYQPLLTIREKVSLLQTKDLKPGFLLRRVFPGFLLIVYSFTLLHSFIPHFHVDKDGKVLNHEIHHSTSEHDHANHADHEDFSEFSFQHLFESLFHVASDNDHLMHLVSDPKDLNTDKVKNILYLAFCDGQEVKVELPKYTYAYSTTEALLKFELCCDISLRGPPSRV